MPSVLPGEVWIPACAGMTLGRFFEDYRMAGISAIHRKAGREKGVDVVRDTVDGWMDTRRPPREAAAPKPLKTAGASGRPS